MVGNTIPRWREYPDDDQFCGALYFSVSSSSVLLKDSPVWGEFWCWYLNTRPTVDACSFAILLWNGVKIFHSDIQPAGGMIQAMVWVTPGLYIEPAVGQNG